MTKAQARRLQRAASKIESRPIPREAVVAAFERFRATGDLPDHRELARAVLHRAINSGKDGLDIAAEARWHYDRWQFMADYPDETPPPEVPPKTQLLSEAVHSDPVIQGAARSVIRILVRAGEDVADQEFVPGNAEMPTHGAFGLYLLGYPECLIRSPHKRQGRRVVQGIYWIREAYTSREPAWQAACNEAVAKFLRDGERPADPVARRVAAIIADHEDLIRKLVG